MKDISLLIQKVVGWANGQDDIGSVVLVGSYARGAAHKDSDVDLMILADDPDKFIKNNSWASQFGEIASQKEEVWGMVKTLRVEYKDGLEVEFNFSTLNWASTDPIDEGSKRVMTDGHIIYVDKTNLLKNFVNRLSSN